jgi:hypothetical protein
MSHLRIVAIATLVPSVFIGKLAPSCLLTLTTAYKILGIFVTMKKLQRPIKDSDDVEENIHEDEILK